MGKRGSWVWGFGIEMRKRFLGLGLWDRDGKQRFLGLELQDKVGNRGSWVRGFGVCISSSQTPPLSVPVTNLPQNTFKCSCCPGVYSQRISLGCLGEELSKQLNFEARRAAWVPVMGLSLRSTDEGRLMSARNLYRSSSLRRSPSCSGCKIWLPKNPFRAAREAKNPLIPRALPSDIKLSLPWARC